MNQKQQVRKLLPAHARPSKPPALHRRGHSYNNAQSHGHNASSSGKPSLGGSKKVGVEVVRREKDHENHEDHEDHEDGMASFLQFCATCEKQIVTPGNSILYCSESCRRKDASKPTPIQTVQSPSVSPLATSYFDMAPPDIVPQRSPTILRPASLAFSDLTLSDSGSPTEESDERQNSEAARYLAQFHSPTYVSESASSRRPRPNRASTGTESGLPSLTNTPASSVGTAASMASYRPLPSRQDLHFPTKSAELVMPSSPTMAPVSPTQLMNDASLKSSASTVTSLHMAKADEVSFKRRTPSWRRSDVTGSSLRQLFGHEATKTRPNDT